MRESLLGERVRDQRRQNDSRCTGANTPHAIAAFGTSGRISVTFEPA
jgi:hypothetical protein